MITVVRPTGPRFLGLLAWLLFAALMVGLGMMYVAYSVGPGTHDYAVDLGNGFQLVRTSGQMHIICGPSVPVYPGSQSLTDIWIDNRVIRLGWNAHVIVACSEKTRGGSGSDPFRVWSIIDVMAKSKSGPLSFLDAMTRLSKFAGGEDVAIRSVSAYPPSLSLVASE